ncbi:hypothetical protein CALVIDRAFT_517511 [Calocera viscosa TUFC12733]|uniref:Csf1 N-terminal domain-containing protein n=1 Tax=Calocera viscosa (strain TUFC12733) TaxID=1330018 RepID=A0A167K713_CALVF|nr:hypothetical protein CALVIDRAFT_517511 [Calocera viscosa TUFC12733]
MDNAFQRRTITIGDLDSFQLNWLLLVIAVVIVICVLFILFYWNRLLARVLSLLIRLRYWKSTNTWIECESVQVSLLSGRLFLKDFRYYSRNQAVRVLKCHITWRYWFWRTRDDVDDTRHGVGEDAPGTRRVQLPCRIFVYMEGVEWFMYNRTPAFDAIAERLQHAAAAQHAAGGASVPVSPIHLNGAGEKTSPTTPHPNGTGEKSSSLPMPAPVPASAPSAPTTSVLSRAPTVLQGAFARSTLLLRWLVRALPRLLPFPRLVPPLALRDLLPIDIHILTGAVTMGNDATPYLLIGTFRSGRGMWGVGPARSGLDVHRQELDARLFNVKVVSRTNPDWRGELVSEGLVSYSDALREPSIGAAPLHTPASLLFPAFAHIFAPLLKQKRKSPAPPASQHAAPIKVWKGLDRFRTEEERTRGEMRHEAEYAKVPGILEAREVGVGWYADVPGLVPEESLQRAGSRRTRDRDRDVTPAYDREQDKIGNGDVPPEWGIDLVFHDATATYGPWMDRQRSFLQSVFVPQNWADNHPTQRLKPGDARLATEMRIFVQLEGATTLRIPTRETSKDWKYDNVTAAAVAPGDADAEQRAYGWINVQCNGTSTVSYVLPAIVGPNGYDTTVEVNLANVGVTSSVNYAHFWQSQAARIALTMPTPLRWNAERTWAIDVEFTRPRIFLLRDHAFLIQDLIRDWNAVPTQDFAVFVPTRYELALRLREYELNLYANDFNVVSKPLSRDDNVFITASGPLLDIAVPIDSTRWRPQCSEVPFTLDIPDVSFRMSFPQWNTHGAFVTERTTHFGNSPVLKIGGSYTYYAGVHRDFIDCLKLNVTASGTVFKCFGWVVRHVMVLRDNYFGQFTSFTTLEEYQQRRAQGTVGDPVEAKYRPGKSNPFDVDVNIDVQDGLVLLPQEVHDFTAAVAINVPEFEVSIDVHETHMGLQIVVPPIRLLSVSSPDDWLTTRPPLNKADCVVLEGLNIACNRLFGPQPRTSTYLCLWEMSIGALRGCVPLAFASCMMASMQAISYTFSDVANSPDPTLDPSINTDVTFVKLVMAPSELLFQCGKSALQLRAAEGLMLDYTDLPRATHSRTVSLLASVSARALIPSDAHPDIWYETANVAMSMRGEFYFAPENWKQKAEAQTRFVMEQDAKTHRALFVYAPNQEGRAFNAWRQHGMFFLTYPRSLDEAGGAWTSARASSAYAFGASDASSSGSAEFVSVGGRTPGRAHAGLPTPTATYFDAQDVLERDETSTDESDNDDDSDSRSGGTSDHTASQTGHHRRENWPLGESGLHCILKPFRLKRDATSYVSALTPVEHWGRFPPLLPRNHWSKDELLQSVDGFHHDAPNTTICLDFEEPIDVLVTPHITQFIEDFYSTSSIAVCSSDREMDILMIDQLSMSGPSKTPTSTVLSIHLHSIALRTLQLGSVPNAKDHHYSKERSRRHEYYAIMHHVLTICDVSIGQSALLIAFGLDSALLKCNGRLGSPRLCLWRSTANDWAKSAADSASMLSRLSFPVEFSQVLEVASEGIQILAGVAATGLTSEFNFLLCNVSFLDSGVETALATITELSNTLRRVASVRDHALLRTQSRSRFLLWTVLQFAEDRNITTDPPFLNLTTFLVQFGRPGQRRSDNGWRILAHIRHCLRLMPATLRDHLNRSINSEITLSDSQTEVAMHREVVESLKKWRTWEIDLGSPSVQALLRALFPAVVQSGARSNSESPFDRLLLSSVFRTTVQQVRLSLVDAGLPEDTLVMLGPLSVTVMTCTQGYDALEAQLSDDSEEQSAVVTLHALRLYLDVHMDGIDMHLSPDLMTIFQRMLRLRRTFSHKTPTSTASTSVTTDTSRLRLPGNIKLAIVDVTTSVKVINLHAAAQKITFDFIVRRLVSASTVRLEGEEVDSSDMSLSTTIVTEEVVFRARSPQGSHKSSSNHRSMAWVSLAKPSASIGFIRPKDNDTPSARIALAFKRIGLSVPHSAIRLYRFVEDWRAEYIPTYHSMIRGIIAELENDDTSEVPTQDTKVWFDLSRMKLYGQAAVDTIAVNLRVLPSTWFSWEYHGTFVFTKTVKGLEPAFGLSGGLDYGVRLESQTIRLVQANASFNEGLPTSAPLITLELPSFDFSGNYSRSIIQSLAVVGYFSIKLTAQVMDDVLVIPTKFSKDVNEILDVISESRKKQARKERSPTSPTRRETLGREPLLYSVRFMMQGFEVGVEAPSSTQFVQATKLEGYVTNRTLRGLRWNVSLTDLMLSLAHTNLTTTPQDSTKNRYRSAYMTIDLEASNSPPKAAFGKNDPGTDSVVVIVQKIHAVMQAAAIGELGDLLDHYQGEMLIRKEQRAEEIETIKAQTQRVLQTFETQDRIQAAQPTASWFFTRFIYISVSRIGVSFPLTLDAIGVPSIDSEGSAPLPVSPAFLFSITAVTFMSEPNNTGSAALQDMSFQFVPRFDQSDESHFEARAHVTRNTIRFPDMKVDIRTVISTRARRVRLLASMTGFDLDLDPTIAPYVFSLIDVYQQGKERFQRLAQPGRSPDSPLVPKGQMPLPKPERSATSGPAPAADVKASFEFKTARVRLFPPSADGAGPITKAKRVATLRHKGLGIKGLPSFSSETLDAETFVLPGLTAWCEYAGPVLLLHQDSTETQPALLLLSAIVHPSRNTLKPGLLPFITELAHNIENRLQRLAVPSNSPAVAMAPPLIPRETPTAGSEAFNSSGIASMQINFSLRIDQSTLEMTCQPHVNVAASVTWESGGFLITVSPGAKEVSFVASIAGISGGLRHGYLSENCVHVSAQDLAVSLAFKPVRTAAGTTANVVSLVVNTQISGSLRFARLQDLLCFKAVWLDSIPVIEASRPSDLQTPEEKTVVAETSAAGRPLITCILLQVRSMQFEADLGQSITRLDLGVDTCTFRSRLAPDNSEVSLEIGTIDLKADRTLSGYAHIQGVSFETTLRQKAFAASHKDPRMLDLRIRLGEMEIGLSTDSKKILQYHSNPIHVQVCDDWSLMKDNQSAVSASQEVQLNFSVKAETLEAVGTILTLPRLIALYNRLQALLATQREGAARESEAFRALRSARVDNPLSDVATAMLVSARSKFREEGDARTVIILQDMKLEAGRIRLAVFPRSTSDQDMVRFEARTVSAELSRNALEDGRYHRNLNMHLSSFAIARVQPKSLTTEEFVNITAVRWFALIKSASEATIFNGPPTRVYMESWEDPRTLRLDYEYDMTYSSLFDQSAEGTVFLALNYALLKWLGNLAQSFQEEMDKVLLRGSGDVTDLPISPTSPIRNEEPPPDTPLVLGAASPAVQSRPATPPPPLSGVSTTSADATLPSATPRRMTYHKLTPGNIELPQLTQLGDITPRSNQLTLVGLRLDAIPQWVHEGATLSLEVIMKGLLQLYSRQLRRIRSQQ